MKTLDELLLELGRLNIKVWLDGDNLRYQAPKGIVTPDILSQIKTYKSEIIAFLNQSAVELQSIIKPVDKNIKNDGLPLSFNQQQFWLLHNLEESNYIYNMVRAFRLEGNLDIPSFQRAVQSLIVRHSILRTIFKVVNDSPLQVILPHLDFEIPKLDLQKLSEIERNSQVEQIILKERTHVFDLSQSPLWRMTLICLDADTQLLILNLHHIICDDWSIQIFLRELSALYQEVLTGETTSLPQLYIEYGDFAHWQHQQLAVDKFRQQLNYWEQQLADILPQMELSYLEDKDNGELGFQPGIVPLSVSTDVTGKLKQLSQKSGTTLFTTLLTAFAILLSRYTNQEDLVVGTAIANRTSSQINTLIGAFVNTLGLRIQVDRNPTFNELLNKVQKVVLEAYAHSEVPFVQVIEALKIDRKLGNNSFLQVMLTLETIAKEQLKLPGVTTTELELNKPTAGATFDLNLILQETNSELQGKLQYNANLFNEEIIKGICKNFQTLLANIVESPNQKISNLSILSTLEREQLLGKEIIRIESKFGCLHEWFEAQVEKTPSSVALKFVGEQLTYQELNEQANQLAHYLQNLGVKPETKVGICIERSLEMVVGILGILKAGGAYVPLDPSNPRERLNYILEDSQVQVLVTNSQLSNILDGKNVVVYLDREADKIAQYPRNNLVSGVGGDNLAYIIYTSGSTGKPKGVLIEHQHVIQFFKAAEACYKFDQRDVWTLFHSKAFDFSVWELWGGLLYGGCVVVVSSQVSQDSEAFYNLLVTEQVSVLNQTPSAFYQLMQVDEYSKLREKLSLRLVFIAGEALSFPLLQPWFERHGDELPQLANLYGVTETTVFATIRPLQKADLKTTASFIGEPMPNSQIYLLDKYQQPVPIGVVGEIYIGGGSVARGYWQRPELTQERFLPNFFSNRPEDRLYKTGDLGRYLPNGEFEYKGRIDSQVKIRGFRIELGEIQARLGEHQAVRECVVLAYGDEPNNKRLVAYIVPEKSLEADIQDIRHYLNQKLPEYMIPSAFVVLEKFPLTSNGKVDSRALPIPEHSTTRLESNFVAPSTPTAEILANLWGSILNIKQVGIYDNFFELGGHSLLATQVISRVRTTFQVELPLRRLFELPTVAQLSDAIDVELQKGIGLSLPPIISVKRENNLPLSWAQQRLWFLHQLESESSGYTIPFPLKMSGKLNVKALEEALQRIVQRHEVLRTRFQVVNNQPVQVIVPDLTLTLPVVDLQHLSNPWEELEKQAISFGKQPFDLSLDAVIRVQIWQLGEQEHVLLVLIHHIAGDGWSLGVFIKELSAHYQAIINGTPSKLPELSIQYSDFAVWQRQWLKGEVLDYHLNYWQQQLANAPNSLELPTDYPRPAMQSFRGAREYFQLDKNLTQQLKQLSQKAGTTLFMTLLAAFVVLMSRMSNQTDIVIGSPIANRNRQETEPLIGFFVNMLALRFDLSQGPNFEAFLAQVREVTLDAYVHQDVPFEMLVETLQIDRNLDRNPLVQMAFTLQNAPTHAWDLPDLTVEQMPWSLGGVRFDLEMDFWEVGDALTGICYYCTDLFDAETIIRTIGYFQTLLGAIVENPQQPVTDLPLVTGTQAHELLLAGQGKITTYPSSECIHHLFEQQVQKTPDAIALECWGQQISYGELNERANQLAHYLQEVGVQPEVLVGIYVERDLEMIVGLLGILKAGGAYIPLDPVYSQERIAYILEDTGISILLTQQKLLSGLSEKPAKVICLDTDWQEISDNRSISNLLSEVSSNNLAYGIYTSGSTGKPKGVAIAHKSVVNFVSTIVKEYGINGQDRILQFASVSFDVAVEEIYSCLIAGGTLVLRTDAMLSSSDGFWQQCRDWQLSVLNLPTAYWHNLTLNLSGNSILPESLRLVIIGSEQADLEILRRWLHAVADLPNPPELINAYGPTEATVTTTLWRAVPKETKALDLTFVPIGKPIDNVRAYVLDARLQLLPIGVPGELYIGGAGVARGYLNRPELNREKFIPNPFKSEQIEGDRLYRTGDLVRYRADGNLEFLGRIDNQVKIRGFRIELGEIEATLNQYPLVLESIVIARETAPSEKSLTAYLVANLQDETISEQMNQWEKEQISNWQTVYEESDTEPVASEDLTFNITGWDNSYTGEPIRAEEMQEWVNNTVARIFTLSPGQVLEIGCGTGLLLSRIAPRCQQYWGTDYSQATLAQVERAKQVVPGLEHVTLLHKLADDFTEIPVGEFDTVIINSVVQYFPSPDYLLKVLKGAMATIGSGGTIFIGDVRSLPLLNAYHALVQLSRAKSELTVEQWQQKVHQSVSAEEELVIAPTFFLCLQQQFPQITKVDIQLKRGDYDNELTQFRYDVTLHLGSTVPKTPIPWLDWQQDNLSLPEVQQRLLQEQPEILGIRHIPNSRVEQSVKLCEWLQHPPAAKTVGQLQQLLNQLPASGVDPEQIWQLSEQVAYKMQISWWDGSQDGCYDVVFSRTEVANPNWDTQALASKPPNHYTNNPLRGKLVQNLIPQVREFIQQKLPNYMMPQAFVILDALPLTPNGKVDRHALPIPSNSSNTIESNFVAPTNPTQEILANLWGSILNIKQVGIHDNFFELGGHSLLATQIISRVRTTFQVELPLRCIFESPTVAQLSEVILAELQQGIGLSIPPILPADREQDLPLSSAQQRLWFLHQLESQTSAYTMSLCLKIGGKLNVKALEEALQTIVQRHEVLRTRFQVVDNQPVQVIAPDLTLTLPVVDLQHLSNPWGELEKQRISLGKQPFDLAQDAVIRVRLWQLAEQEHVLLVLIHHIAGDGWSLGIFIREVSAHYQAINSGTSSLLPELSIQYADFALWQRQWLKDEVVNRQLNYWLSQLADAPTLLALPTDRPRPIEQSFRGAQEYFQLDKNLTERLKQLSQKAGTTLFMTLLSAFVILMSRMSNQTDIVIGSTIANRNRQETEPLIGFFINILALRFDLSQTSNFEALLAQVREVTLDAYVHQDLPFEMLVEALKIERHLDRNPLVQVTFDLKNAPTHPWDLPGLTVEQMPLPLGGARFDLEMDLWEVSEGLNGICYYSTDLFDAQTITRTIGLFKTLLGAIVENPQQQVTDLPLLTPRQAHELLLVGQGKITTYPSSECIHHLFEQQVQRTPDAIAVEYLGQQISYRQLNERANQLAHYLQKLGVQPEVLVGICLERSIEMIIGILGILKAGGAYVPLDSQLPIERAAYILQDTQVPILLTQQKLSAKLTDILRNGEQEQKVICLDKDWDSIANHSDKNPIIPVSPKDLAYVIYTSGSTGKPKGVAIAHQSLVNFTSFAIKEYGINEHDRILQFASISFDTAAEEIYPCLTTGATLVLRTEDLLSSSNQFWQCCQDWQLSVLDLPTAYWHYLTTDLQPSDSRIPSCLRLTIIGGEEAIADNVKKWFRSLKGLKNPPLLLNTYGPTEATIVSTIYPLREDSLVEDWKVPIGRPIDNTQVYVLDKYLQPCPIGIPGELHIAGVSLASCYLNRPDLTPEKFIPNPFSTGNEDKKLYKTGDLVCFKSDGDLEFIGRIDNQVKIRGFRIELGEIEAAIAQHPSIRMTAVTIQEERLEDKRLIAYITADENFESSSMGEFLRQKLPNYMIPTTWVKLDDLPLTSNGKVDYRALPKPTNNISENKGFVAPRNEIEQQLAQIWSEVLNVPMVGIKDNFFELGGNSLLSFALMNQIQQKFGKNLPLTIIFQGATVENFAEILNQEIDSHSRSIVVKMQPHGDKTPLFLIHPGGANLLAYKDLIDCMGTERPLYGLEAKGFEEGETAQNRIEEMAMYYLKAIQEIQPQGPYLFMGWCFGGLVAFEMAQLLHKQNKKTSFLGLIDSYIRSGEKPLSDVDLLNALSYYLFGIKNPKEKLKQIEENELLTYIFDQMKEAKLVPTNFGLDRIKRIFEVSKSHDQASRNYFPEYYSGTVYLIRGSEDNFTNLNNPTLGWEMQADKIDLHWVNGNHFSMFHHPHVKELAKKIEFCIEQAEKLNNK